MSVCLCVIGRCQYDLIVGRERATAVEDNANNNKYKNINGEHFSKQLLNSTNNQNKCLISIWIHLSGLLRLLFVQIFENSYSLLLLLLIYPGERNKWLHAAIKAQNKSIY